MQIKSKYAWLKHLDFIIVDLIALCIAFTVSYRLKFGDFGFTQKDEWMRFILIVSLLNVLITFFVNPYSGIFRRSYYQEFIRAFQLTVYNFLLSSLILYLFKIGADYSREMVIYMYLFYFLLSSLMKFIWKKLLVTGKIVIYTTKQIPLFIIGRENSISQTINNVTAGDFQLYDIQGVYLIDASDGNTSKKDDVKQRDIPVVEDDYVQYILDHNIEEVLVAVQPGDVSSEVYERLTANGVGLNMVIESAVGFQTEDQYISNFGVYKALSIGTFSFTPGQMIYLGIKRIVDILCGLLGMILLIPIIILIKLSYLLTGDSKRIFYQQTRVGQNGKLIRIFKFRSMVPNADELLQQLLQEEHYRKEWQENQKFSNDPRITKVGRILRKTSIDELPQLINVLKGDMSLVGPRPLVVGELEDHDGLKLYQKVKPGITGWWGCNGRSNIDYRERLELEYYYVKHCSLYLDILCIVRTVFAVLKKDGAQ